MAPLQLTEILALFHLGGAGAAVPLHTGKQVCLRRWCGGTALHAKWSRAGQQDMGGITGNQRNALRHCGHALDTPEGPRTRQRGAHHLNLKRVVASQKVRTSISRSSACFACPVDFPQGGVRIDRITWQPSSLPEVRHTQLLELWHGGSVLTHWFTGRLASNRDVAGTQESLVRVSTAPRSPDRQRTISLPLAAGRQVTATAARSSRIHPAHFAAEECTHLALSQ